MKTIIFFRHGKSDWNAEYGEDHERPVNKRGRRASGVMGRYLAEAHALPDGIVTSSAVRARTTLELAAREGGWGEIPTEVTADLYEASVSDVLQVVRSQDESLERLLLVGHEPTWSETIGRLIGGARIKMSTGAMACVECNVPTWRNVALGTGTLRWLVPPRVLRKERE